MIFIEMQKLNGCFLLLQSYNCYHLSQFIIIFASDTKLTDRYVHAFATTIHNMVRKYKSFLMVYYLSNSNPAKEVINISATFGLFLSTKLRQKHQKCILYGRR